MRYYTGSLRNTRQIQIQRKPTTSLRSTLVLFGGLCPHLGLSSVRPSSSSFCCPSDGHIIGLTLPVNSNLVCSGLGLLPERMMLLLFHFFLFFVFYFFTCRLSLPSSWLVVWPSSPSFSCPSAGHIIGLTVPANSNLVS